MKHSDIAISAPGKVLLAGGYLVLDRDFTGLVFGLDARIHVHVQKLPTSPSVVLSEIIVRSPQFRDAEWRYGYRETEDDGGIQIIQLKGHSTAAQSRNKFVETALAFALTYASARSKVTIGSLSITIMADSDYYSHAESSSSATLDDGRFLDFGVSLTQAHKTGLGSSAALVTAFTAAVLGYYKDGGHISLSSEYERACLHNLAQAAHCAAQGKVGSGFDVAAAVYGSCVYRRFSPSILQGLGEIGSKSFSSRLRAIVEDTDSLHKWDTEIDKSSSVIPKGLRLFMCDVDCGSETVGLVKQVLSWKKEDPDEAARLWTTLQKENEVLAQQLRRLSGDCGGSAGDYTNLSDIVLKIRSLIREMSSKAGVPIEPEVQTRLIDACCQLPGVVAGLVPGAGGFDAIALLVRDNEEVFRNLKDFLGSYRSPGDVAEGGTGIGKVRLLGVKQEMEGLKEEDAKIYANWIQ